MDIILCRCPNQNYLSTDCKIATCNKQSCCICDASSFLLYHISLAVFHLFLSFFPLLFHLVLSVCVQERQPHWNRGGFFKLFQSVTLYVLFCCSHISNVNRSTDKEQKEAWNNAMRNSKYQEIKNIQGSAHGCLYGKARLISLHYCWPRAPLNLFEECICLGIFGGLVRVNFNQPLLLSLYIHKI